MKTKKEKDQVTPVLRFSFQDGGDSDSEEEQERLAEYETVLKEHDPTFSLPEDDEVSHDSVEWYQLHLATERIRTPEILFQVLRA